MSCAQSIVGLSRDRVCRDNLVEVPQPHGGKIRKHFWCPSCQILLVETDEPGQLKQCGIMPFALYTPNWEFVRKTAGTAREEIQYATH